MRFPIVCWCAAFLVLCGAGFVSAQEATKAQFVDAAFVVMSWEDVPRIAPVRAKLTREEAQELCWGRDYGLLQSIVPVPERAAPQIRFLSEERPAFPPSLTEVVRVEGVAPDGSVRWSWDVPKSYSGGGAYFAQATFRFNEVGSIYQATLRDDGLRVWQSSVGARTCYLISFENAAEARYLALFDANKGLLWTRPLAPLRKNGNEAFWGCAASLDGNTTLVLQNSVLGSEQKSAFLLIFDRAGNLRSRTEFPNLFFEGMNTVRGDEVFLLKWRSTKPQDKNAPIAKDEGCFVLAQDGTVAGILLNEKHDILDSRAADCFYPTSEGAHMILDGPALGSSLRSSLCLYPLKP